MNTFFRIIVKAAAVVAAITLLFIAIASVIAVPVWLLSDMAYDEAIRHYGVIGWAAIIWLAIVTMGFCAAGDPD